MIAIIVIAGAAIALSTSTPQPYGISVSLQRNGSGVLYPYQKVYLTINATNTGPQAITAVPISLYVNGQQVSYSTYAIAPHQSLTINKNYSYTGYGSYQFQAVADPAGVLMISNRSTAKSTIYANSTMPEKANVYLSIPNSNITYTETFSTSGTGLLSSSLIGSAFNVSQLSYMNGVAPAITSKIYQDIYPYINVANGAYTKYGNGTISYVAWLQGVINPVTVGLLVSSFQKNVSTNPQTGIFYARISNSVSACSYYSRGWTKIVELHNNSLSQNCSTLIHSNYTPSESNAIISVLKNDTKLRDYQAKMVYQGSTALGNLLELSQNTLAAANLSENGYGVFFGSILQHGANNNAANTLCTGILYQSNGINICSVVVPTSNGLFEGSYGLVRSSYLTSNYSATLYSLVNTSNLLAAHYNAVNLISRLNLTGTPLEFQSKFKNTCSFNTTALSCKILNFSPSNNTANIQIKDLNYGAVDLKAIKCTLIGSSPTTTLSRTLHIGDSANVSVSCYSIPIPGFTISTSYNLQLNISQNNRNIELNGTLNVTG